MKAAIYSRISKEDQSSYSLGKQVEDCMEYIKKEGYEHVETYIEDGFSAKNMNRPQLQLMLEDMRKKKFDILVVWKSDRLTRYTLDGLMMVETIFKRNGIDFASVTEDIDTTTPDGMMMLTIRMSMAQNEREKIAERVTMGQLSRAKSGKRNSSARPYGYNVGENLALTINDDEAIIVRQIFDWYLQGWGRIKMTRTLNNKGIPANRGGIWQEKIIGDIIKNVTYTGAVHWKLKGTPESERIIVPNMHEAIITKEIYDQAQDIFVRRRDHDMNLSSYDFVYSTVVKCALCGRSYHGKLGKMKKNKERIRYYRCSGKYRSGSECPASDVIEEKITDLLFKIIEVNAERSYDKSKPLTLPTVDVEKERKRLEKHIGDSKERRKKWSRAMGDGKMTYEEYTELVDEEKNRVNHWQEELDKLPKNPIQTGKTQRDIDNRLKRLVKDWESVTNEERKMMIQNIFKRIVIGKVNGEWKILGYDLAF